MDWQHKRSLTPHQLKLITKRLGLKKAQFARYAGLRIRRVYRMYDGEAEIPVSIALLLNSLEAHGEAPQVPRWEKE